ncbi:hypothetical protein F5884DRAFT_775390 [Xylogone sp. PMI_703]|nr:hypothetical protein F5884DRAFT_775390 [Xylogone sp. PMI_703]
MPYQPPLDLNAVTSLNALEVSEADSSPNSLQSSIILADIPTLLLISHSYSPPLLPSPQLKFDLRSQPNPPKYIRDAHTGLSSRLQEWLKNDPQFISKRDEIRHEIELAMSQAMDKHEQPRSENNDPIDKDSTASTTSHTQALELGQYADYEIRVGIFCAMGKHRSVAMAEELASMSWPGWQVKIEHRDLMKKRGATRKTMKGNKRNEFVNHNEEYQ